MSKRFVLLSGLLVAVTLIGLFVSGIARPTPHRAAALSPALEEESACVPVSVAVFSSRIHVECLNGAYRYFAAPISDPNTAEFLTALTTAMSSIPIMEMRVGYYEDTTSGPSFGCDTNNCRKIAYVIVGLKEGAPLN
jgi:hypothetical protein